MRRIPHKNLLSLQIIMTKNDEDDLYHGMILSCPKPICPAISCQNVHLPPANRATGFEKCEKAQNNGLTDVW